MQPEIDMKIRFIPNLTSLPGKRIIFNGEIFFLISSIRGNSLDMIDPTFWLDTIFKIGPLAIKRIPMD